MFTLIKYIKLYTSALSLLLIHKATFIYIQYIYIYIYIADSASQYIYLNINQLDAQNFIMSLFHASTCFEHTCSSSGGQNCTIQPLVSSHLWVAVRCTGRPLTGVMIPETV